ncbi:MAG: stage V sporulation protein S [Defluviitaleaceae bacterium]|nr:stage V sporulation protein S [Defluviitaleaceae bacterium]
MEILKISATSNPGGVAGAIATILRRGENLIVSAIGSSATYQAVKSICIAHKYVEEENISFSTKIAFHEGDDPEMPKTSIRFYVNLNA